MEHFSNKQITNFIKWIDKLDKEKICNDFVNNECLLDDVYLVFNINGVKDDYYDVPIKDFKELKENLLYSLQNELELIDEDLNAIIIDNTNYPDDAFHFIDIYIENRKIGLKILYGTYYPEGFEEKYEVLNED